jgi:serine/threonine-protein kinase
MPVPQPGTTIPLPRGESFQIGRVLGRGGMGTVVEATHAPSGRRMALKFLHDELKDHPTIPKRFMREVELATALTSAHVARTFGTERTPDGTTFMIMELLDGRDLCSLLRKERQLSPARAAGIVAQACEALEEAHARGIVHRDLKPENLFVGQAPGGADWVKVLDFGISKSLQSNGERGPALTRVGTTVGTPEYMAPEQLRGAKDLDGTADVYSLGVVLYEALAGRRPFDAKDYEGLVRKICSETPTSLRQLRPDCPPVLVEVVERAMARDRKARLASARALREALEPFATGRKSEGTLMFDPLEPGKLGAGPTSSPSNPGAVATARVATAPAIPPTQRAGGLDSEEQEADGSRWGLVIALALVVVLLGVGAVILLLPMIRQM